MSKKSLLNEFRNYGIGLVVKFGIPLLMMTASSGVLAQTTTKSNDREVQRVLDLQTEQATAKKVLSQYVSDSTFIAKNFSRIKMNIPYDVQAEHQSGVYKYMNSPFQEAEVIRNIRNDMDRYKDNIVPVNERSNLLEIHIKQWTGNTGNQLRDIIKQYPGKYNSAVSELSPQQKSELDNVQNNEYGATGSASAAPADFKTSLKQELNKIEKYKISVAEKTAELDTLSDMYLTAQWLDRFPTDAVSAAVNAVEELKENKSNSEASEIICLLRNYYHVADADADKFNGASPMNSVMQRKMIIGEIAVQKAEAARVSNNLEVYSSYTQKAYEAAKAGNRKEADRLLNERNGIINARPERVPSDVADNVRANAIKESFDFDLQIIRDFQEQLKSEKTFVDTANYVLLAPRDVAETMQKREESINMMQDKLDSETNPQFRGSLEKELKKQQNEYKSADSEIKKYVESNRKQWGENIHNLYLASVADEGMYISARDQVLGNGTASTKYSKDAYYDSADAIAFHNNKETIQNGNRQVGGQTMSQYNSVKNDFVGNISSPGKNNIIEYKYKSKNRGSYSNRGISYYGTYSNAGAYVYVNKSTYEHNGRVGASSNSNRGASVHVSDSDNYVRVQGDVHYNVNTSGKGFAGLKALIFNW